jgi:hypothetical protein
MKNLPQRVIQFPHLYLMQQRHAPSLNQDSREIYRARPPVWKTPHNIKIAARVEQYLFRKPDSDSVNCD